MNDLATLNELAEAEIVALEGAGYKVTPRDVIEINAMAWAVESPETRRLLARGRPVPCGGVYLWPLTIRGIDWLTRNRYPLDRVTPEIGYAMAHGYSDGNELDTEGREASKLVKAWFRRLPVTRREYAEAVKQVDDQDAKFDLPPDPSGKPMTLGDFSAFLAACGGADADFWERRCSFSYALAVMATIVMQNRADDKPSMNDPRIRAERVLGYKIEKIKAASNV